jgi:dihydropteroate synthase
MWKFRNGQTLTWGTQTYIMGVLNVTPDSFSDGGQFNTLTTALAQAQHMVAAGADLLDVGGQSTRPQADTISVQEELDRVVPVIQALRSGAGMDGPISIPISIDTTRAAVARAAIAAGADIVNDISGGRFDPELLPTAAEVGVPIILMHSRGTPKTMQQLTTYEDVIQDIIDFLNQQIETAIALGIPKSHIAIDPGIGFAKTYDQNLEILRRLTEFRAIGCPLLVGTSRKRFIGHILNQPDPQQRAWGTAATCCVAIGHGADIVRVHDVKEMRDVCRVADAIYRP